MRTIIFNIFLLFGVVHSPIIQAEEKEWFRYCLLSTSPYGEKTYYSAVFRDNGDYFVGMQNKFNSYISAEYDPQSISGAICMGPYDSYSEAEQSLNDDIASRRRNGKSIEKTYWTYRGD